MKFSACATLALGIVASAMLTGCANMMDSLASVGMNIPENAPAGYASYIKGQQYVNNRDFGLAQFSFCHSAELGYTKAKKEFSKYSVIDAALTSPRFASDQRGLANLMRRNVCAGAQYGEPAKSLCQKIQTMGDEQTINAVIQAKNKLMGTIKNTDSSTSIQIEDF